MVDNNDLDIKTLGGAGFASQCTTFTPALSLNKKDYSGLVLRLPTLKSPFDDSHREKSPSSDSNPTSFVLALKNEIPAPRSDSHLQGSDLEKDSGKPRMSVVSYEYAFDIERCGESIEMKWEEFVPTFRGRRQEGVPPLNSTKITE